MPENRYALAGWLSITGALLFVASFVVGILEAVIAGRLLGYHGPVIGPADLLGVLFAGCSVYALVMFRRLLHERYEFHGIDTLISLMVAWSVLFQAGALLVGMIMIVLGIGDGLPVTILSIAFFSAAMISGGIIGILTSVRLLQAKAGFSELIKVFAYVSLASGVLEVSVLLAPLALLIVPASFVLLGMILLRGDETADFV